MAKKQTRRSISVSRGTYERLKAFCEANSISMSQFVERRVGDYLGEKKEVVSPMAPKILPYSETINMARTKTQEPGLSPGSSGSMTATPQSQTGNPAMNQQIVVDVPVKAPEPYRQIRRLEHKGPILKDPDEKLSADQIFTF